MMQLSLQDGSELVYGGGPAEAHLHPCSQSLENGVVRLEASPRRSFYGWECSTIDNVYGRGCEIS